MPDKKPIPIDENAVRAAQMAATGANIHDVNCMLGLYRSACRRGNEYLAKIRKRALLMLVTGIEQNDRAAMNRAMDLNFEEAKERKRKEGTWHKDWDEYLGVSPDRR